MWRHPEKINGFDLRCLLILQKNNPNPASPNLDHEMRRTCHAPNEQFTERLHPDAIPIVENRLADT